MFMFRKIVRGAGYFVAGLFIGAVLWAIGTPAFAQAGDASGTGNSPDRPAARIVFTSSTLQLFGLDGREKVALTSDGVELSDGATIDFSPDMRGPSAGVPAGTVIVRIGGALYVMPVDHSGPDSQVPR